MLNRSILYSILFFVPLSLSAQIDFVVTNRGDTLRGSVKLNSFDHLDKVQVHTDKKKLYFTALQVKYISTDGYAYQPVQYGETAIRFMRIIKSGYLSLYAFNPSGELTWGGRYLTKKDGTGMEVPNLSFKKFMIKYLSDCPEVQDRIEHGNYKNDLGTVVDMYNDCLKNKSPHSTSVSANSTNSETLQVIKNLYAKIEKEKFFEKKDALDILNDIQSKVSKDQSVPNYLVDGLKSHLTQVPSLSADLERLVLLLKK